MTAPTPEGRVRKHLSDFDFSLLEDGSWPKDVADLLDALAAVTAERDQAVRELAEQKRVNTSNLRTMTEQLDQARQMLADAQKEIVWLRDQAATGVMRGKKAEQMLADAPHGDSFCEAGSEHGQSECVCWKSGL